MQMANTHFPGSAAGQKLVRGKLIRSPYVTSQKFFMLSAINRPQKSGSVKKAFGVNGIARWNER
jgi:hypothetical protein